MKKSTLFKAGLVLLLGATLTACGSDKKKEEGNTPVNRINEMLLGCNEDEIERLEQMMKLFLKK